uniref:RING-type domain-containing protein n=1 Tax=Romanomermis culicivorax TaxID=13658 RepID=A0A915KEV6_ROMCU
MGEFSVQVDFPSDPARSASIDDETLDGNQYIMENSEYSNTYDSTNPPISEARLIKIPDKFRCMLDKELPFPPIEFPLSREIRKYSFGNSLNDAYFFLPIETLSESIFGYFIVENFSVKLFCSYASDDSACIKINGQTVKYGEYCDLYDDCTISLGPLIFHFSLENAMQSSPIGALIEVLTCPLCDHRGVTLKVLPCDHKLCPRCLSNYKTDDAVVRFVRDQWTNTVVQALVSIPTIRCPFCRRTHDADRLELHSSASLWRIWYEKMIRKSCKLSKINKFCASCGNWKCLTSSSEFWLCSTCNLTLCPVCVFDKGHVDHQLKRWREEDVKNFCRSLIVCYGKRRIAVELYEKEQVLIRKFAAIADELKTLTNFVSNSHRLFDKTVIQPVRESRTILERLKTETSATNNERSKLIKETIDNMDRLSLKLREIE